MAWSTRELAELADTTVNTIRHYHRLGLLDEPERKYNGYKQYGAKDLVRLLRIRRMVRLGVPLAQIGDIDSGGPNSQEMLRDLDAELVDTIERLQQARADIATILRDGAPVDGPAGFESVAAELSPSDSSILHISGQLYDQPAMSDLRRMVEMDGEAGTVGKEIDVLPADADEATRDRLVGLLAPILVQNLRTYPWLLNPAEHLSRGERVARQTFIEALVELYNPAQLDVFGRASVLAQELLSADADDAVAPRTRDRR